MTKVLRVVLICSSIILGASLDNEIKSTTKELKKESKEGAFFKRFNFSGFGYISYFRNDLDLAGQSMQYRLKLDSSYDIYDGYLAHLGIFFSQGSSTPNANSYIYGGVHGSRGGVSNAGFSDRFGIGVFGASKTFNFSKNSLEIKAGRFNLDTPLNNNKVDLYSGIEAKIKYKNMQYFLLYSFSYMADHLAYGLNARGLFDSKNQKLEAQHAASIGIGNPLFIAGLKYKAKYIDSMFYIANSVNFFDIIAFGQTSFKQDIGDFNYSLNAQIAYAKISNSPSLKLGGDGGKQISSAINLKSLAQNRGVYNLNMHLGYKGFKGKIGVLGSFADGYGVLLNSVGGLDLAGRMWQNNFTSTYEGFGILGSGGYKNSNIFLAYMSAGFGALGMFGGMDIVFIGGDNFFPLSTSNLANRDFIELTPHFKYNITKQLEFSLSSSFYFLDFMGIKTRVQLQYKF